ncbi:7083_t:CDS:2 [Entrophospora sp. SA101]|nr:7083_t:CDS:2 [Entrophospora sp. SA101]
MYNTDKYFDFDSPKRTETKISKKTKQQSLLGILLLVGAAYYYFMIYLPEEEIKQLEVKLQAEIDRIKNAQPDDVEFNEAVKWLQEHQKTPEQLQKELEDHIKISNVLVGRYNQDAKLFPDGDKHEDFHFSRAATYDIHFPPSMKDFFELGKEKNKKNCYLLDKNEDLIWSTPGTGKSATVKKICIEADECPLVIVKGSSLTPTKQDYDAGIAPLQKFVYTISELENPTKYKLPSGFNIPSLPDRWQDTAGLNEEDNK